MSVTEAPPVIIAGAGMVGLLLAQLLKRAGIPFQVYERDTATDSRYGGWAITLHWILPELKKSLPRTMFEQMLQMHVDPEEAANDKLPFRWIDMATGKPKFDTEVGTYLRIARSRLRDFLSQGIDIQWGKAVEGYEHSQDGVKVNLSDGSQANGRMLAACDGKNSASKYQLVGRTKAKLNDVPLEQIGLKTRMGKEPAQFFIKQCPVLWQGTSPDRGVFFLFSVISTPESNNSAGTNDEYYEGQFNISWRPEVLGKPMPKTNAEKLALFKELTRTFFDGFSDAFNALTDQIEVINIKLQDWPPEVWTPCGGRVTILGDAAHPMVMYRGEGVNHGMYDAILLASQLEQWKEGKKTLEQAVSDYEGEMRPRGRKAVLLSREAAFQAHNLYALKEDSPLFVHSTVRSA